MRATTQKTENLRRINFYSAKSDAGSRIASQRYGSRPAALKISRPALSRTIRLVERIGGAFLSDVASGVADFEVIRYPESHGAFAELNNLIPTIDAIAANLNRSLRGFKLDTLAEPL